VGHRERLLARDLHAVRFSTVALDDADNVILFTAHLEAAVAAHHQLDV
jgi:hypothetical protein